MFHEIVDIYIYRFVHLFLFVNSITYLGKNNWPIKVNKIIFIKCTFALQYKENWLIRILIEKTEICVIGQKQITIRNEFKIFMCFTNSKGSTIKCKVRKTFNNMSL